MPAIPEEVKESAEAREFETNESETAADRTGPADSELKPYFKSPYPGGPVPDGGSRDGGSRDGGSAGGAVTATVIDQPGALDWIGEKLLGNHVRTVFYCWIVLFGLVGTQMGWVLRPFIGNPDKPFTWFRVRESNFFEAVWQNFLNLFS